MDIGAYRYPVARLVWLGHRGEWLRNRSGIRTYVEKTCWVTRIKTKKITVLRTLSVSVIVIDDEERRLALLKLNRTETAGISWDTEKSLSHALWWMVKHVSRCLSYYSQSKTARIEALKEIEESDKILAAISKED